MTTYDDFGMPVGAYSEPESLTAQAWRVARAFVLFRVRPMAEKKMGAWRRGEFSLMRMVTLVKVLVVVWIVALYYGERRLFDNAISSCEWENWENWEAGANPHRLLFVADPQLVDPHTYPDRPWLVNAAAAAHSDLYMRRSYSRMQRVWYPDSVAFLGDLFDGGREWSTRTAVSADRQYGKEYKKYGDSFWLKEYDRFGKIFFGHWGDGGYEPRPGQPGRKLLSSLPGNHDLGLGSGIQTSVRRRFNAYFGEGNRVDVLGNHTFVSLDSVSLSALGQENPESTKEIWTPPKEFLETVKKQKKRVVQRELRAMRGMRPYPGFKHDVVTSDELAKAELPHWSDPVTEFPTILLTHVPLYRSPGTPCGPLREKYPPTPPPKGQTEPLEIDDRNAISVSRGYQYQNVMHQDITADIAEKVGDIRYAFSGDDHDYCEVVHRRYPSGGGGIREITVKSISWTMGVRKPGVLLVSMWNPVDTSGNPLSGDASKTLQTHLCLLPDQIGTFLRYATLFGITLLALIIRAALVTTGRISTASNTAESPLLPTTSINTNASSAENEKAALSSYAPPLSTEPQNDSASQHSSNSSTSSDRGNLQVRNPQGRTRSVSPNTGYSLPTAQPKYTYPLIQHAGYNPARDFEDTDRDRKVKVWGSHSSTKKDKIGKRKKGWALFWGEMFSSLGTVALCGLGWYGWLVWNG